MGNRALFTFIHNGEEIAHFWNRFDGSFDGISDGGKGKKIYELLKGMGEDGISLLLHRLKNAIKIEEFEYQELYKKFAEHHRRLDEDWRKFREIYGILNANIDLHFNLLYPTLGNDIVLNVKELINPTTLVAIPPIIIDWKPNELEKLKSFAQYKYTINLSDRTFRIVNYLNDSKILDIKSA